MSNTGTLAVHAAGPEGTRGVLLLMWPPDDEGWVRCREWSSDDWLAPGRDATMPAVHLLARVRGWAAADWRFSEPLARVVGWLDGR